MTIYEIDQSILDCVDLETGEIIDIEKFENLQIEREIKIDNTICFYKNVNGVISAIEKEIENLSKRKKQQKNLSENLKSLISYSLEGQKFETSRNKVSWRKSESINIINEKEIPNEFKESKIEIKISKDAIKKSIKNGIEVNGAEMVFKNNIQIN